MRNIIYILLLISSELFAQNITVYDVDFNSVDSIEVNSMLYFDLDLDNVFIMSETFILSGDDTVKVTPSTGVFNSYDKVFMTFNYPYEYLVKLSLYNPTYYGDSIPILYEHIIVYDIINEIVKVNKSDSYKCYDINGRRLMNPKGFHIRIFDNGIKKLYYE